jgi:glyoxylase-like metal-dependent hydrolase (beta-lactamase superfamily II)
MTYKIKKIDSDVWAIEENMVRCFLIHGEGGTLLIDSCMSGGDEFRSAITAITDNAEMQMTVTHTDGDHIGGFEKTDTVLIHPSEYVHLGEPKFTVQPVWDGDIIKAGNRSLTVKLLPGHTPGSTAFVDCENKVIFIGDTVSDSNVFMFGEGRNLSAYIASLRLIQKEFDGFEFYACHGSAVIPYAMVSAHIDCAEKLLTGEIEGVVPPFDLPCKLYGYNGANLLFK